MSACQPHTDDLVQAFYMRPSPFPLHSGYLELRGDWDIPGPYSRVSSTPSSVARRHTCASETRHEQGSLTSMRIFLDDLIKPFILPLVLLPFL